MEEKFLGPKLRRRLMKIADVLADDWNASKVIILDGHVRDFNVTLFVEIGAMLSYSEEDKLKNEMNELGGIYTIDILLSYKLSKKEIEAIKSNGVTLYKRR